MRIKSLIGATRPFLTGGGLETYMVFDKGFDLPSFSSHVLLDSQPGREALKEYYQRFLALAAESDRGFVIDTETWRLNTSWAPLLGLSIEKMFRLNAKAVGFAKEIQSANETKENPILISGTVGPSGDVYCVDTILTAAEALSMHFPQVQALGTAGVDLITAMTLTHAGEAEGIAQAAKKTGVPVVISFTLETDGRLPSGQALAEAIAEVDEATQTYPIYYMINCAHPDHFRDIVANDESWKNRIGAIRANASRMSHAELDEAEELDPGDPVELGRQYSELLKLLPNIRLVGGCCGTDHRHVGCIAQHDYRVTAV